ncbi:MAG: 3'-5' exonuclease, partial [Myxococcales bacterium]|nr:3'-5' exonuclease [Myxococcales bacterium]
MQAPDAEWCVVDLETTGMDLGGHDRILEVAFVVLDAEGDPIEE